MSSHALQRTAVLLNRVDNATEQLVTKFSEIISLAANTNKDHATVATDTFQIETNASSMVKAAEDLLFVTRSLKEAWILGQIRPIQDDSDDMNDAAARSKSDALLQEILNGS